ncbi:MAG TPA: hypothetical protein VNR67_05590 [Solirubrobacterales bacterium]|nr:hypothetical protein [Solirubrobacterales bacterium]
MTELVDLLLHALPPLLLVLALIVGRYPGCEAIVRLSERIAAWARPRFEGSGHSRPAPRPPALRSRRLLLALSLSGRAPPAAA